jgi:hypothetical protein
MSAPPMQPVPPPPGPGVQAPFVTPPTDGARQRRFLAGWLTAAAVAVCFVGAIAGIGGVVVLGQRMIVESAQVAVEDYLTAVQAKDYAEAYEQLCDREQDRVSAELYAYNTEREPAIESFVVGEPDLTGADLRVPATLRYRGGDTEAVTFVLDQDERTGGFEVCGRAG